MAKASTRSPGGEPVVLGLGGGEGREAAVGDHDALGGAGGAGGEDDVGRVVRVERAAAVGVGGAVAGGAGRVGGQEFGDLLGVQGQRGRRVAQHRLDALLGVVRVDGQEGGAGLGHREFGEHRVGRAGQQQGDGLPGAGSARDQPVGQPVGVRLGLGVGQLPVGGAQRDGLRPPVGGGLDQGGQGRRGHRGGRRSGGGRAAAAPVRLAAATSSSSSRVVAARGGQRGQGVQQLVGEAPGGLPVEEARVVAEFHGEPLAGRDDPR
nr:hypothetical protein KitaXyl93_77770 [Kitasatospora sp. Xyl93]